MTSPENPAMQTGDSSPCELPSARLPRRTILKWFAAIAATSSLPGFGAGSETVASEVSAPSAGTHTAKGYGTDPLLSKFYAPGDFWPLTFSPDERKTATALADLILPADHLGPAASEVRTPDYIDEKKSLYEIWWTLGWSYETAAAMMTMSARADASSMALAISSVVSTATTSTPDGTGSSTVETSVTRAPRSAATCASA